MTQTEIIELYTATFARAADAAGVAYWETQELTQTEMANAFVISEEAMALYPETLSDEDYIEAIYQNNFNRAADADGLAYWLAELTAGTMAREDMIVAVINGATDDVNGNDQTTLDNKSEVSQAHVDAGLNDTDFSLTTVTDDDATVTAAIADVDAAELEILVDAAAQAAYDESILASDATDTEVAEAALLTATTAEAAIEAGGTQAEIDAEVVVITNENASEITLSQIVALDAANTAVTDYLAAVDSAYDNDLDGDVSASDITAELSAAAVAYNATSNTADLALDGSDTEEEIADIQAANLAELNLAVTTAEALLNVEQVSIDAIDDLEEAITASDAAVVTYEAAFTANDATEATVAAASAAYNVNNGTAVLNADGTVSDSSMIAIAVATDGVTGSVAAIVTFTFGDLAEGQSITVGDVTITADAAMLAQDVAVAFEAAYTYTGFSVTTNATSGVITYTADAQVVYADGDQPTASIGTETTNEGLDALVAANVADIAADAALTTADTALTAAVQLVVDTEQGAATVMNTGIITISSGVVTLDYAAGGGSDDAPQSQDFIDAQIVVTDAEAEVVTLGTEKADFDAINAVDDALTPLETTAAAAALALVGETNLADATIEAGVAATQDVSFITDLVAGNTSTITANALESDMDYIYVGTDFTVNTGALTTGDDSVLEMFITEGATSADTLLTFETATFGSSSASDFFTVELTGVAVADVAVEDGLISL